MKIGKHSITAGDLFAAWFIGSPVAFAVLGIGVHFMPAAVAVAIGVAAGFASGLALLAAVRRG